MWPVLRRVRLRSVQCRALMSERSAAHCRERSVSNPRAASSNRAGGHLTFGPGISANRFLPPTLTAAYGGTRGTKLGHPRIAMLFVRTRTAGGPVISGMAAVLDVTGYASG